MLLLLTITDIVTYRQARGSNNDVIVLETLIINPKDVMFS